MAWPVCLLIYIKMIVICNMRDNSNALAISDIVSIDNMKAIKNMMVML